MEFSTLCEVIAAVHLSYYVVGPFPERGGLMLIAPPGHLKTTAVEVLQEFPRVLVISNLTVKSLTSMRNDLLAGNIRTLVFSDYSNIHKRHGSVSSNIEGILMGLVSEGFRKPAYSDQRVQAMPARAAIVGCMTDGFATKMEGQWSDDGFYRRFIWSKYRVDYPELLDQAILEWRKAEIDGDFSAKIPSSRTIAYTLTPDDTNLIDRSFRFGHQDKKMALILSQKIMCVLKWKFHYKDPHLYTKIWKDFAESLGENDTVLHIKEKK